MSVRHCTGKRSQTSVASASRRAHSYQQSSDVRDVMYGASTSMETGAPVGTSAQATVTSVSSCAKNSNSAPNNAASVIDSSDARASGYLQSASIFSFLAGFGVEEKLDTNSSAGYQAYESRFGPPEKVGKVYRDRFTGNTYATESAAKVQELYSLSDRYDKLSAYLDGGISYHCNSKTNLNIATCSDRCSSHPNWVLWTCAKRASHAIAVCPSFWTLSGGDSQRAIGIIHELAHQRFEMENHLHGGPRERGRNPECYASYAADMYGITPFDNQCPPI